MSLQLFSNNKNKNNNKKSTWSGTIIGTKKKKNSNNNNNNNNDDDDERNKKNIRTINNNVTTMKNKNTKMNNNNQKKRKFDNLLIGDDLHEEEEEEEMNNNNEDDDNDDDDAYDNKNNNNKNKNDDDDDDKRQQQQQQQKQDNKQQQKQDIEEEDDDQSSSSSSSLPPPSSLPSSSSPPPSTFEELGLSDSLISTCYELGMKRPTMVQRVVIPFLLTGRTTTLSTRSGRGAAFPPRNRRSHLLTLSPTGSGKTASFVLPIIQQLIMDPYGIYAVIISPTRELAKQIHQHVLALGSAYNISSVLVVGGLDICKQSCTIDHIRPHFIVATPGRLSQLLKGPNPPNLQHVQYMVLDEADRLLTPNSGYERDVAELILHCNHNNNNHDDDDDDDDDDDEVQQQLRRRRRIQKRRATCCQTLLFSATMTQSLQHIVDITKCGLGRLPLQKFIINDNDDDEQVKEYYSSSSSSSSDMGGDGNMKMIDDSTTTTTTTPQIPAGLKQEYVFMPSRVRDAYLLAVIRTLVVNGGRKNDDDDDDDNDMRKKKKTGGGYRRYQQRQQQRKKDEMKMMARLYNDDDDGDDDDDYDGSFKKKARSAIIFVSTCERTALISGVLEQVGVSNVALHSIMSQNRRLAVLETFKSEHVRILVATDVASRGLDIPSVDIVINAELPRDPITYIHRVGRTARAGRRGRSISLISEYDIQLVHCIEKRMQHKLRKCVEITDDIAIRMLNPVTKSIRIVKMKLDSMGFHDLVQKYQKRKIQEKQYKQRIIKQLSQYKDSNNKKKKKMKTKN